MRSSLILPDDIREAILIHTTNCDPEECCGLIAFDDEGRMRFAYPLSNTDRSDTSFTIDPEESYRAFLHADKKGWAISGVFHSHSKGPDTLSDRDLAESPRGWIHLLSTPSGLTAFRVSDGFAEELEISPARDPSFVQVAAGILIRDGRVLVCHRSPGRQFYPDVWDLPGGHVDPGESPAVALQREIQEELSVKLSPPLPSVWKVRRTSNLEISLFIVTRWEGEPLNTAPEEHDQIRWVNPEELVHLGVAHDDYVQLLPEAVAKVC